VILRVTLLCCCLGSAAFAQSDPTAAAIAAADRLEEAGAALAAAGDSRDRVAALTQTVRAYEDGLVALRDGLRRAAIRQRTIEQDLAARNDDVARLLGVLQTMGRAPAPLLLLHPSGPTGTARAGMMLSDVTPALQADVDALRVQLEEITALRALQDRAAGLLGNGLAGAQDARAQLSAAISDRTDLPQRFTEDAVQTALLIASTDTLDAFAGGLLRAIDGGVSAPLDAAAAGGLDLPVQGTILRGFEQPDAAGISRPGVLIAARPRALVTTPGVATVRYRGPLLQYGNVTILEPAADVLWVFAGMAEVFGEVGQVLPAGSPVGLMGGESPEVDAILSESAQGVSGNRTQTLYLEVREGQSPVDPATWFALE
jgi:septal ring factor EnvC (AmiA/AmiB activator)